MSKLINKLGINFSTMIRYGSIATFTMLLTMLFFGEATAMLAFPIALTGIALSLENIHVRLFSKSFKIIILYLSLVTLSFLATRHIYIGIFINFCTIFLIAYFFTFSYNPKIYKPFLMLFIFTSFSHGTRSELFHSLIVTIFGTILVIILTLIFNKDMWHDIVINDFIQSFSNLIKQFKNIENNNFDLSLHEKISKEMRVVAYKIYTSRFKYYLLSNKRKLKFDLYLHMQKLNLLLYEFILPRTHDIDENIFSISLNTNSREYFISLSKSIECIFYSEKNNCDLHMLTLNLENFLKSSASKKDCNLNCINKTIQNMILTLKSLENINKNTENQAFTPWIRSHVDSLKSIILHNKNIKSIRVNFALRISIVLTLLLFLGHLLNPYKAIWLAITVMSVMQIYYEDTISKSKGRILGNLIGIIILTLILSITHIRSIALITLVIALYLVYAFKEYYKLSIFTTIASISAASLSTKLSEIDLYRIILVGAGLIAVTIGNKFLFPTKIEDGVENLISKLILYDIALLKEIERLKSTNKNSSIHENSLADILILIALTTEKISTRNQSLKNKKINIIIERNNSIVIDMAYSMLVFNS